MVYEYNWFSTQMPRGVRFIEVEAEVEVAQSPISKLFNLSTLLLFNLTGTASPIQSHFLVGLMRGKVGANLGKSMGLIVCCSLFFVPCWFEWSRSLIFVNNLPMAAFGGADILNSICFRGEGTITVR